MPLILVIGVTLGALFGLPALLVFPASVLIVAGMAKERVGWIVLVAVIGAAMGVGRVMLHDAEPFDESLIGAEEIEGVVDAVPRMGPSGLRASIDVLRMRPEAGGEWTASYGKLLVFFGDTATSRVNRDDVIRVRASVDDLSNLDPDFRRFVRSEGSSGVAWAFTTSVLERSDDMTNPLAGISALVTRRILDAVPGDAGALLAGFVTGDDSALSDSVREAFDRTNTSHITAVSGANIAILVAMWSALAPTGRIRRQLLFQVTLLATIWCYVGLVGFGPAALRAAVFASLMIPASRFSRKPDAMTSLMLASAILLLLFPDLADSVGFWLSMAASAALVTVAPLRSLGDAMSFRWVLLSLVAAQFATLPITFWIFGQWSPASLIANLLIGPMVSAIFPLAFLCAALFLITPLFGTAIGWLPGIGAEIIIATVKSLGSNFSIMRSGPLSATGALLIAILSGAVIACLSVDVHRWIRRTEFAHRVGMGLIPAGIMGALIGLVVGVLVASWA